MSVGVPVPFADWTEEMWQRSDAQRDRRLAKLVDRTVSKKAKASAKGTPSNSDKVTPRKTVVSPKSLTKLSAGKKTRPAKRRVYQATLDKLLNLGKSSSKCQNNENNDNNANNVESKVIFPIIGKFALTTGVVFPTSFQVVWLLLTRLPMWYQVSRLVTNHLSCPHRTLAPWIQYVKSLSWPHRTSVPWPQSVKRISCPHRPLLPWAQTMTRHTVARESALLWRLRLATATG